MIYNINKSEIAMNIWIKAEKAFHKTRHQIFIKSFSKWRVEGYILNLKVGVCEQAMVQMMPFPKRKNQCFSAKLGNKLRMHERADGNPKRSNHFENECLQMARSTICIHFFKKACLYTVLIRLEGTDYSFPFIWNFTCKFIALSILQFDTNLSTVTTVNYIFSCKVIILRPGW